MNGSDQDFLRYLNKTIVPVTSGLLLPFGFKPFLKPFKNPDTKSHIVVGLGRNFDFSIKITSESKIKPKIMKDHLISYIVEFDDSRKKLITHLWNTLTGCLTSKRQKRIVGPYVMDGVMYNSIGHYARAKGITEASARKKIIQSVYPSGVTRKNRKICVPFYIDGIKFNDVKSAASAFGITVEYFRKKILNGSITIHKQAKHFEYL